MNVSKISNINKIGQLSGIKHSSKVSFKAVSIESDSFSLQTRNDLIISDGDKKISELINNGLPEKINEIDADNVEIKVKENSIDTNYKRLKPSRKLADYKEALAKTTGFAKIAGYDKEKIVLDKYSDEMDKLIKNEVYE